VFDFEFDEFSQFMNELHRLVSDGTESTHIKKMIFGDNTVKIQSKGQSVKFDLTMFASGSHFRVRITDVLEAIEQYRMLYIRIRE